MTTLSTLSLDVLRLVLDEFIDNNESFNVANILIKIPFPRLQELVKISGIKRHLRFRDIMRKYMSNMRCTKPYLNLNLLMPNTIVNGKRTRSNKNEQICQMFTIAERQRRGQSLERYYNFTPDRTLDTLICPCFLLPILGNNCVQFPTGITKFTYSIPRYAEIASSFIIRGRGITKVVVEIGGTEMYQRDYFYANLITVRPFQEGIRTLAIPYQSVVVHIYASKVKSFIIRYLYIRHEERKTLMTQEQIVPHLFYSTKDKKLYTKRRYTDGRLELLE